MKEAGQDNLGRNLIIPTYLKDISGNKILLRLWDQARHVLANATEITVVGFQANPADALARLVIGMGLLQNERVTKISFVSPDEGVDHWDSFCLRLGKTRKRIRLRFEDWVQA
jgi:hypothetical protein